MNFFLFHKTYGKLHGIGILLLFRNIENADSMDFKFWEIHIVRALFIYDGTKQLYGVTFVSRRVGKVNITMNN